MDIMSNEMYDKRILHGFVTGYGKDFFQLKFHILDLTFHI